jgi:hypothetical protein
MEAFLQKHFSNLQIEFSVALYYFLSKQSHSLFHDLIIRSMKEIKE